MINATSAAALAVSMFFAPFSSTTVPPTGKILIDVVTVTGQACPAGSTAVALAADNTAFSVTFSGRLAQGGGASTPLADIRKTCQLSLRVHVPSGFTYAIAEATYRGSASLASGATGSVRASHNFQGDTTAPPAILTFAGPFEDSWQLIDKTADPSLVFLQCGQDRNLTISLETRVNPGTAGPAAVNAISLDPMDGSSAIVYRFAWQHCPAA